MEGSTTEGDGRGDNNHRPMGNSYANTEPSRCRSTISTASCTLEEMQATLTRFRELCGALRTHFRSSPSAATTVDRSDQSLKQFSDCGLPQGFAVLRGVLSLDQQLELARKAMEEYAFYPHNNLTALVRWSCLGMNYDWTNRVYVEGWKSDFPEDLAVLCVSLAREGGFNGEYNPEAAIVNFYTPAQMMGPHRDDAELTMGKPIVSISLGCDAIFCIETKPFDKDSQVACMWVRSGDVVVMGGESREALHGVAVTIPRSFHVGEDASSSGHLNKRSKSESSKVMDYLMNNRININVRQVEDPADPVGTFACRRNLKLPLPIRTNHPSTGAAPSQPSGRLNEHEYS